MAMQTAAPPSAPSAQVVGNAFVEQYYHILHHSPELVYRFYQDSSVLSRQDPTGVMTSVTTMKNINDKICSLDYKNYKAEIKTADAQESYKDGVIVLVTGCLTGKDNLRRKFTQTFFLAPQDKGYFVLNDVFRYVEENEPDTRLGTANGTDDVPISLTPEPEPAHVLEPPTVDQATSHTEVVPNGEKQAYEQVEKNNQAGNIREIMVEGEPHSHANNDSAVAEPASSSAQEDAPKKSYASILSSQTKKGPTRIYVPGSATDPEDKDAQEEVEGNSIYVRNLPLNVTVAQLELEFKKFGPIKQGGVQVRSNKQQGLCFGFVEFQDLSSMHSAIQNENDSKRIKMGLNENCELKQEGEVNSGKAPAEQPAKPPEPPKQDYVHVRARRGQATDSHSLAERVRREKISERMKILQDLVPGCNKVTGKAVLLDEIINYVQSLQRQVEFLSMRLEAVNSRVNPGIDGFPSKEA